MKKLLILILFFSSLAQAQEVLPLGDTTFTYKWNKIQLRNIANPASKLLTHDANGTIVRDTNSYVILKDFLDSIAAVSAVANNYIKNNPYTGSPENKGIYVSQRIRTSAVAMADSGINLGQLITNPSSPTNGRLWGNSTDNSLNYQRGGTTVKVLAGNDAILNGNASQTGNFNITGNGEIDGELRLYGTSPAIQFFSGSGYYISKSGTAMQIGSPGEIKLRATVINFANSAGTTNATFTGTQLRIGIPSFDGSEGLKVANVRINNVQAWDAFSNTTPDLTGITLKLYGGRSTGTGVGGAIDFYTSSPGTTSGMTLNDGALRERLDGNGFHLYYQNYTPTSSSDIKPPEGAMWFDDNYLYVKRSGVIKRIALTSF